MIDLRLGRWQSVLGDVECDALITDPPYSERTHKGALSSTGEAGVTAYKAWSPADASSLVRFWSKRTRAWMVIHTDDVLGPVLLAAMDKAGRYVFPLVPVLQHQPRQLQDGPAQHGHYLAVSRPRDARFVAFSGEGWGSLPGWYGAGRGGLVLKGDKPIGLMRAIVRDYSRPGDLVCDPCAGGATTLIAAATEGRRAVGAEMDPKTHALATTRIDSGYTPDMFSIGSGAHR